MNQSVRQCGGGATPGVQTLPLLLPVGLEVVLPVSDQGGVPLHHDAVQRPRSLDDAV